MKLGIDFGTTHTTAAVYLDGTVQFVKLDSAENLLRSMIYITREQEIVLGRAGVQRYLAENTGRMVITREKAVGTVENWVARMSRGPLEPDGPIQLIYDVIIDEDISSPGRLIQSIKTGLRQEDYKGTNVFDKYYSVQELIALILKHVKDSAEAQFGQKVTRVVIGRPVKMAEDPEVDAAAQTRLNEAVELAGFTDIKYLPEPLAAARFYLQNLTSEQTVLVFDFGGGTLDLSILSAKSATDYKVLSTHGVLVGGDDFDSAIMQGTVSENFGKNATMEPDGRPVPLHLFELLANWQTIPLLSRAENLPVIRKAQQKSTMPDAFKRMEALVIQNYGFPLFEAIESAKRRLSDEESTSIVMDREHLNIEIPITRREFQITISQFLGEVQIGINAALEKAGLSAEDIDVVISTGGSSLVPIYKSILERKFTNAEIIRSDTFGSVGAGLAIAANDW